MFFLDSAKSTKKFFSPADPEIGWHSSVLRVHWGLGDHPGQLFYLTEEMSLACSWLVQPPTSALPPSSCDASLHFFIYIPRGYSQNCMGLLGRFIFDILPSSGKDWLTLPFLECPTDEQWAPVSEATAPSSERMRTTSQTASASSQPRYIENTFIFVLRNITDFRLWFFSGTDWLLHVTSVFYSYPCFGFSITLIKNFHLWKCCSYFTHLIWGNSSNSKSQWLSNKEKPESTEYGLQNVLSQLTMSKLGSRPVSSLAVFPWVFCEHKCTGTVTTLSISLWWLPHSPSLENIGIYVERFLLFLSLLPSAQKASAPAILHF